MTIDEIEAVIFFIKLSNNYLISHQNDKKSKEKTIYYTEILKHKLVLENLIKEKYGNDFYQSLLKGDHIEA